MQRFSLYGSPRFEEDFFNMLVSIRSHIVQMIPKHKIKALILGGGYGRGEGGVFIHNEIEKPYNDLDLFLFVASLNYKDRVVLKRNIKTLHKDLSEEFSIDIDFSNPIDISSLPYRKISLMYYDLLQGHYVLLGNKHLLNALPEWHADELPVMEALHLLLNRCMGLIFAQDLLSGNNPDSHTDFINRNIHKAFQALAEAELISEGKYETLTRDKIQAIQTQKLPFLSENKALLNEVRESLEFKLRPNIPVFNMEALTDRLEMLINASRELYYTLWSKVLEKNVSNTLELSSVFDNSKVKPSLKNMLLNLRDTKCYGGSLYNYFQYPRFRLFLALPHFIFNETMPLSLLTKILGCKQTTNTALLKRQFIMLWYRYN
ncbi:MAG: hypothetical protein M0Q19_05445 [Candidatus Cloacimonetes bacterium]|nr:hypothetical protein [Candidatus Cloacimonadota bacterium]MDD4687139.1 hypothetical protein [Candidatus Cloacimonadota bacterium]